MRQADDEIESASVTEKDRRVYYQDIVYDVCRVIDSIDGKSPGSITGVVCGTVDTPTTEVQQSLHRIKLDMQRLRRGEWGIVKTVHPGSAEKTCPICSNFKVRGHDEHCQFNANYEDHPREVER